MAIVTDVFDSLFDPLVECLTPSVAERIANLRGDPVVQARLDELADKCTEGDLTSDERTEYETYVRAIDLIAILQAKVRKFLESR